MVALTDGEMGTLAEFPMLSEQDKANEEAYWQREQARWDFGEWQVSQHEAQDASDWETMSPDEHEAAGYELEEFVIEPW